MADFHSPEDEAVLYVLGELNAVRRKEFEARMEQSAELRALVRELEEGAVALSMASTPRRPPAQIWSRIEKEVQREGSRKSIAPPFWTGWWRSGWAVAATSLAGWAIYAVLTWHSGVAISQLPPGQETEASNSTSEKNLVPKPAVTPATSNELRLLKARTEEADRLHREIAQLEKETSQLSQLLVRQHALLGESNRIKFYQLTPVSADGGPGAVRLSPALQRAVFLSIGRQLGWLPVDEAEKSAGHSEPVNIGGVDFVDLRPTNNNVVLQPTAPPHTEEALTTNLPTPTIPAFASGDSLVVAVDSTVVPTNSYLTLTVGNPGLPTAGGTIFFGDTPTVVTIPLAAGAAPSGLTFGVSVSTALGHSNTTQYFTTPNQQ